MPLFAPKASTEVVYLSNWAFVLRWGIILAVHVVTCVYNALYAYAYWMLASTFLNLYLESCQIGMPPPHHKTIAIVHATMSAVHGVCVLMMVGGSIRHRSLSFTPKSSDTKSDEEKPDRTRSVLVESVTRLYSSIFDRRGVCGVNGDPFHVILICREVVETALQTVQAYRMSVLLPRTLLNRFYVLLLSVNCWSSVIVYSVIFKGDEARRRFTCIVLDCVLDLVACMGVELMVLLSYAGEYSPELTTFPETIWFDVEDGRGCVMELIQRHPTQVEHQSIAGPSVADVTELNSHVWGNKLNSVAPKPTAAPELSKKKLGSVGDLYRDTKLRTRCGRLMLRIMHLLFGVWGFVVLGFHIHAAVQPTLAQCLLQVRPWAVSKPFCYLVGLNCHDLGITGKMDEVQDKWSEFDSFTVAQVLIRHCPELEMPDIVTTFHRLRNIKIYNTTILEWGESAAITNTNHPAMASLLVVRVNMTDGLLPMGFQSADFPQTLYDFEFCVTNLRTLPDDLDTKWPLYSIIQLEYGQFDVVPPVLARLEPLYLMLDGNPLREVPPEVFEVQGMIFLSLSNIKLAELPRNVTNLSAQLSWVFIGYTDISFFWNWTDPLVMRMQTRSYPWLAGPSPYCDDLAKIENGTATAFRVPLLPEYSQTLMDPSEENRPVLRLGVLCDSTRPYRGLFYPLDIEDGMSAISIPPALPLQV